MPASSSPVPLPSGGARAALHAVQRRSVDEDRSIASDDDPAAGARYTALIRTHNSLPVLDEVVAALRAQTIPPSRIVAVDSHSTAAQRSALGLLVDEVVTYPSAEFNYARAINVGVGRCDTPWILIISSHVVLEDPTSIGRAISALRETGALAFYFHRAAAWSPELIDRSTFDGRNGLHNTCAFVPRQAVEARPFREEVFSAEDQEWAASQLADGTTTILRIGIEKMNYANPNMNEDKFINEEIAIAFFTCRKRLGVRYVLGWLLKATLYFAAGRFTRARSYLTIGRELVFARFRPPVRGSRYF